MSVGKVSAVLIAGAVCVVVALPSWATETVYPVKDGTLADGGSYGPFDGVADDWDWYFNESSYEGTITLSEAANLEHRLVWEYDLSGVTLDPPVSATITFTVRGAPAFPRPDVDVHVYSYPADLQETPQDFSAGPAVFQGSATVPPYEPPTAHSVTVSRVVSEALSSGTDMVAFRLQVDPAAPSDVYQAFIDATDSDPPTKPFLTIQEGAPTPGDVDGDGDVDLDDFRSFPSCMDGPGTGVDPTCQLFDFDEDTDVDLADFGSFQSYLLP